MIKIEERNTGNTLYASELATTVREGLVEAVSGGAYLRGAYLRDTNLAGANLAGANLAGAYLRGANLANAMMAPSQMTALLDAAQAALSEGES